MRFVHDTVTGNLSIVAPRRALRLAAPKRPGCPFCPGAEDATPPEIERVTPRGSEEWLVRAIPNLFPLADRHEVHILSPRHITSTHELTVEEWTSVADMWQRRLSVPASSDQNVVHLFVNDGRAAGASMDHLHSQLVEVPATPLTTAIHDRNSGMMCAACTSLNEHPELEIWRGDGLVIRASNAPSATGSLWLMPLDHVTHLDAHPPEVLARALKVLAVAGGEDDRNIWFSLSPDRTAHWFATLLPRTATLAGVELGLGVGVSLIEPIEAATAARERVSALDVFA